MKTLATLICILLAATPLQAQDFDQYFTGKTLRVDYLFTGNAEQQSVCVDGL